VAALRQDLGLPAAVCQLVALRGHGAPDAARRFLRPRLDEVDGPALLMDLDRAVERLVRAARAGETVLVHGDYDVDGMCSTTIMVRALRAAGANAVPFIPNRLTDGYDLTSAGVQAARAAGATVVLTCDCGTSAHAPVAELQAGGIDVIISDHHLPGGALPDAYAILNPQRPGCPSPDKGLAAVGVAFKLAMALTRAIGGNVNTIYGMLDLVALATIADIAPLRGENRVLARYGLRLLNETPNPGLRALIRAAGLEGKPLTAGRVGFVLAPRLNAVGRLGSALRGVELLMARDEHTANSIARELEEMNARRQEIDRQTLDTARAMAAAHDLDETYGLVLAQEGWHPGVIGIVASRIVEEFCRPAILVAVDKGEGKGSGRSISAFDLHSGIGACADLLVRFGGHRAAAGITISQHAIPAFAERFNDVARQRLTADDLVPELRVDLEVDLADVTAELEKALRHLEPCGMGNPSPVLATRGMVIAERPRVVGKDGLKLLLQQGEHTITALGWGMGARASELHPGAVVDVAYRLERDEFRGVSHLQARLADFRLA
jgi:single-stranded-DNA-specific exonuclease